MEYLSAGLQFPLGHTASEMIFKNYRLRRNPCCLQKAADQRKVISDGSHLPSHAAQWHCL